MSATADSSRAAEALADAAATALSFRSDANNLNAGASSHTSTNDTPGASNADAASSLSADLALFLSHPSLRAALTDGSLDLQSYADTVQNERNVLEAQCIAAYRDHAEDMAALEEDVTHSQHVLAAVREMLLGFQADLGGLSGDIRELQEKSKTLDIQLTNRKAAEGSLRGYLQRIVVAPAVAQAILTGPVNCTAFVEAVQEVQDLYKNCCSDSSEEWSAGLKVTETVSGTEMKKELETLRLVAVKRSREYMLQQMTLLRRPQTNVRILQVHGLLKYVALFDFLEEMGYAHEIVSVYCESMRATLLSLFSTYSQQLLQLDLTKIVCTRTATLIAIDDSSLRAERSRTHQRLDVFCLGTRATDCLGEERLPPPITAHIAAMQKEIYPYERLFQSLLGHLVDAVTNEHVFCRRFFQRDTFDHLFPNTLSLLTEHLENYLFTCHDAVALLLMVSVTHAYRRLAQQRALLSRSKTSGPPESRTKSNGRHPPIDRSLDGFFDQITKLLWPRLKTVMEGHLRSIQMADAEQLGSVDLHAHYVSRRFGELCCSLLQILHNKARGSANNATTVRSSPVRGSLARQKSEEQPQHHQSAGRKLLEDISQLIDAFVLLLERLAESKHSTQKMRTVFLINNLDHIVCIFQERRVTGKECSQLVEQLIQYRERFVEEELLTGFSKMIAFVQQTELHLQQSGDASSVDGVNPAVVESLLLDFTANWKSHMEQINRNVLSYFSNFRNGMEILKHCLTQLLLYYTRFQEILRKIWKKSQPAFTKELVPTNVILTEIKKYALAL